MERRQGCVAFKPRQHLAINQNWPIVLRPAVHYAMSDRYGIDALLLPEPSARRMQRGAHIRDIIGPKRAIDCDSALRGARAQTRARPDAVHLAPDHAPQVSVRDPKYLKFDAGGPCVDDENRAHGGQAAGRAAVPRRALA